MTQSHDDPLIPTLTQVVKPARRRAPEAAEPSGPPIPAPGPLPTDLDIDLPLHELDEPSKPILPLEPVAPPARMEDNTALRRRIETLVDETLAAQLPALRQALVEAVLRALDGRRQGS